MPAEMNAALAAQQDPVLSASSTKQISLAAGSVFNTSFNDIAAANAESSRTYSAGKSMRKR
jgi:hypothetical protein